MKTTHGGARDGAGAKPKDPEAGARKMWSGRLHTDTHRRLAVMREAGHLEQGAGELFDELVAARFEKLKLKL